LDIEKRTENELIEEIQKQLKNYRPKKVRRKLIEKDNGKMRPLGIPCILDRIIQQCFKQVLEPIAEAHFYNIVTDLDPYGLPIMQWQGFNFSLIIRNFITL
jgi:RNA-directed DNA polymerase